MSEEFDVDVDEFIIEEDNGPSNRPFLLAAGALVGVLILSLLCLLAVRSFTGNGEDGGPVADQSSLLTSTSIAATNEAVATQNSFVTQTVVAMEMTENAPTATFTPTPEPPTETPTPTNTTSPTDTPVGDEGEDEGELTSTPVISATSIFEDLDTVTPVLDTGDDTGTGDDTAADTTAAPPEELPETGISLWEGFAAALGLLFLVVVARRLRTS